MSKNQTVSIIVPTLNEEDNIAALFQRIDQSLQDITYEIILIDDHSTDLTVPLAESLGSRYPVHVYTKQGQPGKAQSLLEGFAFAQYDVLCMIDADLQYPPEAIGPMLSLLHDKNADVVVTDREENETSLLRKITSKGFNFVFARLLFGISYDTQSGLKLFRKAVLNDFEMKPSPWSFDLEFLVRSLENKRKILSYTIPFSSRTAGATKVKVVQVAFELAKASLSLRYRTSTRKIRDGHRANNRFIRKAFPATVLTFLLAAGTLWPARSQALDLNTFLPLPHTVQTAADSNRPLDTILSPILSNGTDQSGSMNGSASDDNTTSPSSSLTNTTSTTQTATNTQSQPAAAALATYNSSDTQTNAKNVSSAPDRSTLKPATAQGSNLYGSTAISLSAQSSRRASMAATAAITAGIVTIVTVILIRVRYQAKLAHVYNR